MSATAPASAPVIDGKKTFIPLENNPETLTPLSQSLGVSPRLSFHDVLSLTEPELLAAVPRPAAALIFLAPSAAYNRVRSEHTPAASTRAPGPGADPVYWARQTIGHACGSMSLLHAAFNLPSAVAPGSALAALLAATLPLGPDARAQAIYDCAPLERAHMAAAAAGASRPPDPSEPNALHFITFVKGVDGTLWELEGGWPGPIDRGSLAAGEDVLSGRAVEMGVGKYLQVARDMGEIEFSAVAVVDSGEGGA